MAYILDSKSMIFGAEIDDFGIPNQIKGTQMSLTNFDIDVELCALDFRHEFL